jgi:hypothetical protein
MRYSLLIVAEFQFTPIPILFRSRSVYFERAFSASCFVLNGCDSADDLSVLRFLLQRSRHLPPNLLVAVQ